MLYRITQTFVFDLQTDDQETIGESCNVLCGAIHSAITPSFPNVSNLVCKKPNVVRLKQRLRKRHKCNLAEFKPEEILQHITHEEVKKEFRVGDAIYLVSMNSHRYFTFNKSLECAACGLKGTKMLLESDKHPNSISYFFNLYAVQKNELILMTKDHIIPKAQGGLNELSNYATCCSICNNLKGSHNITFDELRVLRKIYDENKHLPRRSLWKMLNETRNKMSCQPGTLGS